jgi:hypothetical protein
MTVKKLVTFPDGVWRTIEKELMPQMGDGESEVIRGIVIAYLEDKGYLVKSKISDTTKELATHDIMIGSLVQELSTKGIINFKQWEENVQRQIQ